LIRYSQYAIIDEDEWMEENFLLQSDCLASSNTATADYLDSGVVCQTGECEVEVDNSFNCIPSDTICTTIVSQSKCGKLLHIANEQDSKRWG